MRNRTLFPLAVATTVLTLAGCGKTGATSVLVTRGAATPARATAPAPRALPAAPVAPAPATEEAAERPLQAGDEVIVKFRDQARDLPGATKLRALGLPGTAVYKVNASGYALQAASDWELQDDIEYVETIKYYHAVTTPNDPETASAWGIGAVKAPAIWNVTTGEGVKVAVIDTGCDYQHPDLAGQLLPGVDVVGKDDDAQDEQGHGTHVAGTIAALTNNAVGVPGVAPGAKILPVRVLDASGRGSNADIAAGILAAADRGAQILNLSLGGSMDSETMRQAVANVQARGVIVVAAAGNSNVDTRFYPAAIDGVIAVAATDKKGAKASFSNFGDYIDVAAPGVGIGSTKNGGGYHALSGTSMASPHVAGALALLKGRHPSLKLGHLTKLMRSTGGTSTGFTSGVVPRVLDVQDALAKVSTLDMQPPTVVAGLSAAPAGPGEVALSWAASSDNGGAVSYRVLRNGKEVGTTTSTRFVDSDVAARATYRVVAEDADGNEAAASGEAASAPGQASTALTELVATKRSKDSVTLTWKSSVPMRCQVQFGTTAALGQASAQAATASTTHSVTLSGLKRNTTYQYRVYGEAAGGEAHYTTTRKVRTKLFFLFAAQD